MVRSSRCEGDVMGTSCRGGEMLHSVGISKGEVLASVGICGGASAGVVVLHHVTD